MSDKDEKELALGHTEVIVPDDTPVSIPSFWNSVIIEEEVVSGTLVIENTNPTGIQVDGDEDGPCCDGETLKSDCDRLCERGHGHDDHGDFKNLDGVCFFKDCKCESFKNTGYGARDLIHMNLRNQKRITEIEQRLADSEYRRRKLERGGL